MQSCMVCQDEKSISLQVRDLDLDQIAASGQCFTWRRQGPNDYSISAHGRLVKACQKGNELTLSCSPEEFEAVWKQYLDLETDYGAVKGMVDPSDPYLARAVQFGSGIRILRQDLWEVMVSFLISQNNNITRITRSISLLCQHYGQPLGDGSFAFPRPGHLANATVAELETLGLGYRSKYLKALADQMAQGGYQKLAVTLAGAGNREAMDLIQGIYGIGCKVASCICLFGLHHINAFPVDTHIKKILGRYYPDGFPYHRYDGYLGILQQYMFYYDLYGAD